MAWSTRDRSILRSEIVERLVETAQQDTQSPNPADIYVPVSHIKALDLDAPLVVGMRGAGKSYWSAILRDNNTRKLVSSEFKSASFERITDCSVGFSTEIVPDSYPGKRQLKKLLESYPAQDIWMAIVCRHILRYSVVHQAAYRLLNLETWDERVQHIKDDPGGLEELLYGVDKALTASGKTHLIVFDALDRAADDWSSLRKLIKGLLQVLLELRSFKSIRAKAFLRPDMLDAQVLSFPDASKLEASRVELDWNRSDLYGLLFQRLGNLPQGGKLIRGIASQKKVVWEDYEGYFRVPLKLRQDELLQRGIFHELSGPYMGSDARRGLPYTWLPNHLGDVAGRTSPRSFLTAVRQASESTIEQYSEYVHVLHYEAIKQGVRKASEIRKKELDEDFPWVGTAMNALSSLTVPCAFSEVRKAWQQRKTLDHLAGTSTGTSNDAAEAIPHPPSLESGAEGLRKDLIQLHVFQELEDGRINIPDVYRVGYGLGRRGGVKPVR
jgi:hypothetical protein